MANELAPFNQLARTAATAHARLGNFQFGRMKWQV